jgi:hypothetical protein
MPRDHLSALATRLHLWSQANSPINRLVVALGSNHLGRQVIGGSAERPCNVGHLFCEAKVGNLQMPMAVQEQVFRLQIAVDDVVRVQVVEGQRDLGRVEFGDGVREALSGQHV